jgi:hypothetical protein
VAEDALVAAHAHGRGIDEVDTRALAKQHLLDKNLAMLFFFSKLFYFELTLNKWHTESSLRRMRETINPQRTSG